MGIRIRHLELLAMTGDGPFGVSIPFENGLTVLSAPNTSGKSTCAMGILYALGLEGMLGPSHMPPFPASMTDKLMYENKQREVVSSRVRLEIENDKGEFITLQRMVLADLSTRQLINVELGPAITAPKEYDRRDFYVRTGGSATTELGFHAFLAKFAGYDLPMVNGADGSRVPLYLECLCPYFFVDQISGWRDVKARMPTFLRIPEMAKRGFEFTLTLDVLLREVERQSLLQQEHKLTLEWSGELESGKRQFQNTGVMIEGIPEKPEPIWPPTPVPRLLVTDGKAWFSFSDFVVGIQDQLIQIRTKALPSATQTSEAIIDDLRKAENLLAAAQQSFEELASDVRSERAQVIAIDERLTVLREDMRKYQNAKRLKDRGGFSQMKVVEGICPTCNQPIKDALLDQDRPANPMSLEDNIAFLHDQVETFQEMREESRSALTAKEKQFETIRNSVVELSALVRDYKRMLRSDGEAPSAAAIREELQLEQRLETLTEAQKVLETLVSKFADMAKRWTVIQSRLKVIVSSGLSEEDSAKLTRLNKLYLQQLGEYGFSSYPLAEISLSPESYRPTVNQYEMGLTSASDAIRSIWAYLLGMLEVARSFKTNHIGFIVFDEPKQQSAADFSFAALLTRAATSKAKGQQVIFSTSEKRERLDDMLKNLDCKYIKFDGKMLTPMPQPK